MKMNRKIVMVAGAAVLFGALTPISSAQKSAGLTCSSPGSGAPMLVTADCVDSRFNKPYVDIDEPRTTPVPHRYVHGGFTGTDAKFSFYFPPREQFQGRFFQNTHQLLNSENGPPNTIAFAVASGAYYVQTNIGGAERATTTEQAVFGKLDPSVGGYRVNAEAAKFSRVKAAEVYGSRRVYGYLYGGSGGAFQTISSAEHTVGVWDGFVPYVMGSPNAIPGVMTVRIHALRVLRLRDRFPAIMDAIDPGGSGDPYAGLNAEEAAALKEATRLGFPLRGWWNHPTMNGGPLALVAGYVPYLDPTYSDDFWTKPGYLGTDAASSVSAARIQHKTTIVNVIAGNQKRLELSSVPTGDLTGADLIVTSGAAAGKSVALGTAAGKTVGFGFGANPAVVNSIQSGDEVRIDNSSYLALQTYHRHQLPTRDMYGWNQFRNGKGEPLYPQRKVLIGPIGAMNGAGSLQNGQFNGKMIALESLMDIDALPWQADWYRTKVKEAKGQRIDDEFRLYFIDYAQHTPPVGVPAQARTVSYQGALEQALRDVSAWVERGVKPPASTNYKMVDSQVEVAEPAAQRGGIQPVVRLTANGRARAEVAVGTPVAFSAVVEAAPNGGKVVAAEWDFEGRGNYPVAEPLSDLKPMVTLKATYSFSQPGTYFAVLRATSQREGDPKTPYARIQNLGRVRVVVSYAQQPPPTVRPPLLFREDWRLPRHEGAATDENTRFTPEVVTNDRLEAKLYGPGSAPVRAAEHEGRVDLWTGLATSPVAVTLRDKRSYVDLTGLARLRWIVRTNAIHTLYPVVKLADGTLAVGSRGITTDDDFLQVEVAFTGMKWFKLDPQKIIVMTEVKNPDLSKVDEVGLASLAPGGGHGIAGSANLSTVELFAKAVAR